MPGPTGAARAWFSYVCPRLDMLEAARRQLTVPDSCCCSCRFRCCACTCCCGLCSGQAWMFVSSSFESALGSRFALLLRACTALQGLPDGARSSRLCRAWAALQGLPDRLDICTALQGLRSSPGLAKTGFLDCSHGWAGYLCLRCCGGA